jgi:hypothetical protein
MLMNQAITPTCQPLALAHSPSRPRAPRARPSHSVPVPSPSRAPPGRRTSTSVPPSQASPPHDCTCPPHASKPARYGHPSIRSVTAMFGHVGHMSVPWATDLFPYGGPACALCHVMHLIRAGPRRRPYISSHCALVRLPLGGRRLRFAWRTPSAGRPTSARHLPFVTLPPNDPPAPDTPPSGRPI